MPEFGQNFRTQILVGLKAEGVGEADRIAQEMARLERAMGFARERFRQTITDSTELRQELAPLKADFNTLAKILGQLQSTEAAQVATQAQLISSSGAWAKVIRETAQAARDQNQQLADMARLRQALGAMEQRAHGAQGDEALRQQQLRDTVEQAEATRESIRLQQTLGAMERRTAQDAAEAATLRGQSTRSATEQIHQHQADERLMAQLVSEEAQAERDLAQVRQALGAMEARDSRERGEGIAFVARAQQALVDNERTRLAEEEQAATRRGAAIEKHTADVQKSSNAINAALDKETEATRRLDAAHDAEMSKAAERHAKIMGQAAEEAAIYAQRVADRRSERGFADAAQTQIDALQRIGAQEMSNVQLYGVLDAELQALIAKGSTRTNDDFDRIDTIKSRMKELVGEINAAGPVVRKVTDDLAQQNTVINAGAAYTQHHAGSWHGFSDEVRTAQMAIKGTNDATQQGSAAMGRFGYGILNVAHAAQDAQYGLGAVLNNIPLVTQSIVQAIPALERFSQKIGGPMGLAGAAMLLAVAANSIYNNFDKIKVAFVGGTPFGPLADDVEKLTRKVEELDGAWLQSIEDVHAAAQAHRDLKDAAEAAKIAATPTEEQEKRKKSFAEAVKETPGGAQAAQNVARELEASRFFADPAGAVKAALESGRMPIRADLGITPERIGRTITDDRMYAIIKEQYFDKVIPALANQAIAGMGRGEAPAFKDLMGRAMQHPRLGERDEAGNLTNVFLRKLEQTSPEAQKHALEVDAELERLEAEAEESDRKWKAFRERRKRAQDKREADANRNEEAARQDLSRRIGQDISTFGTGEAHGGLLQGEVRTLAGQGVKPEDMLGRLMGPEKARLKAAGVEADAVDEVARGLINKARETVLAQLTAAPEFAKGGLKAAAGAVIQEGVEKQQRQQGAQEKRAVRDQAEVDRGTIAGKLVQRAGGNISPEQGMEGAEQFQRLVKSGENPARAQAMVVAHMLEFVRENIATAAQISGMNEQMAVTLRQATMQLGAIQARLSMTEGRMKNQRWQQPPPWNTIGGG